MCKLSSQGMRAGGKREGAGVKRQKKESKVDARCKKEVTYPEEISHTLIVLSLLAETNLSPSCVNRTVEIL